MAIVILGVTVCPLCGQPISDPEGFIAFPHFIEDEQDPFWVYSDAAFHKRCLDDWPKKGEFLDRLKSLRSNS